MASLAELAQAFTQLSLMAFGGANAALPEIHRLVIDQHRWMDNAVFSDLFAISQAAPGPNVLLIALIGLQLAGLPGFLVTTAAFCVPSSLLMYGFDRWGLTRLQPHTRMVIDAAVGPLSAALVLSSGWLIVSALPELSAGILLLTAATVVLVLWRRIHPLWWIAAGALLGGAGLV